MRDLGSISSRRKVFLFLTSVYFISETHQDSGSVIPGDANAFMTKA
jgi:hypothetical protein